VCGPKLLVRVSLLWYHKAEDPPLGLDASQVFIEHLGYFLTQFL